MNDKQHKRNSLLSAVSRRLSRFFSADKSDDTQETDHAKAKQTKQPAEPQPNVELTVAAEREPENEQQQLLQEKLRKYVIAHIADTDLNVTTMAKAMNVGRTTLFTMVHEAFGMTPGNYINERRLEYAIQLLKIGTKASVVARRCGFADPKYFGKVFKKRFGILPSKVTTQNNQPC